MPNKKYNFTVSEDQQSKRVDQFIVEELPSFSRTKIAKLVKEGALLINGKAVTDNSKKVTSGDEIELLVPEAVATDIKPQKIPLDIVYEDDDLLVINKPIGMVVHPGAGNPDKTLVNALLHHCKGNLSGINGELRPGIVHRIDKDTSGLLVVAKNDMAHNNLAKQFEEHSIQRTYLAFVWGMMKPIHGRIETFIGRSKYNRQKMSADVASGKDAITNYKTLEIFKGKNIPDISLIECKLETGRTHQIRVHLAHKKNPILGDQMYGSKMRKIRDIDPALQHIIEKINFQALHAQSLGFIHPTSGEELFFTTELPQDLLNLKKMLKKLGN
ncbi:MAG: RluA family pseudouridine synthase [Methylophilaceae bacterium]|jgi:23S rRNA pseudouridine1911/1915/1917 synthase